MESKVSAEKPLHRNLSRSDIHPAWQRFMDYCRNLGHGELAKLQVQDGLPVAAEFVKEKIKF